MRLWRDGVAAFQGTHFNALIHSALLAAEPLFGLMSSRLIDDKYREVVKLEDYGWLIELEIR